MYRYDSKPWPDEGRPDSPDPPPPPPRSDFWDYTVKRGLDPLPALNVSTKAAVYSGILSVDVVKLDVPCSSINCTWTAIPTLAVCGECNSMVVESMCTDKSQSCLYTMPSGMSLDVAQNAPSTERFKVTASRRGIYHHFNSTDRTYISVFDVLWVLKNRRSTKTIGQECALWFCMQTSNFTVVESNLTQTPVGTWNTTRFEQENNAHLSEYVFINVPPGMNAARSRYSVTTRALEALQRFVGSLIEGTYENQYTIINFSSEWVEGMYNARWNLPEWISRLSTSLTNEVRLHGEDREKNKGRYAGRGDTIEQVIYVEWKWLIFPTSLIVISIYYLSHTIIRGARDGVSVWKSDSLPMLFCRIDPSILHQVGDGMDLPNGLDKRVGEVKVCLLREEDGDWVFKPIESEESSSESESESESDSESGSERRASRWSRLSRRLSRHGGPQ